MSHLPARLLPCLVVVTMPFSGCGGEAPPLAPVDNAPPASEPISLTADCDPDSVVVGKGGPRVSRTATLTVRHGEAPADLLLWISGPDGKQAGETYENGGKTSLLPVQPYPANATMTWHVRMCGEVFSGTFRTGELMRPVDDARFAEAIIGETFALDLRVGDWSAPFDALEESLVYQLGGAFLLDVVARDNGVVRLALTAADPDNAGGYERDDSAPVRVFDAPFADNPYAFLTLETLTLPANRGVVVLRDALIGVGFDDEGVADAFVQARLEVDAETCSLLTSAGGTCEPCDTSAHDAASCVALTVDNLYGVSL